MPSDNLDRLICRVGRHLQIDPAFPKAGSQPLVEIHTASSHNLNPKWRRALVVPAPTGETAQAILAEENPEVVAYGTRPRERCFEPPDRFADRKDLMPRHDLQAFGNLIAFDDPEPTRILNSVQQIGENARRRDQGVQPFDSGDHLLLQDAPPLPV